MLYIRYTMTEKKFYEIKWLGILLYKIGSVKMAIVVITEPR